MDFMSGRSHELEELMASNVTLFINSIIEMEWLQGARNNVESRRIEKKLTAFRLLNMQQIVFDLATQFIRDYRLSHGLLLPDAVIGATAIYYQMPLFTYNRKDFDYLSAIGMKS